MFVQNESKEQGISVGLGGGYIAVSEDTMRGLRDGEMSSDMNTKGGGAPLVQKKRDGKSSMVVC
jgi:hypothetical protein